MSDRVGRKPVYIFGALVPAALMFLYLWAISQASIPLIFLFGVLMSGVAYSASNGIWPSFCTEDDTHHIGRVVAEEAGEE